MHGHDNNIQCFVIQAQGAVQGVGFRPFVYRLATELGLGGFVANTNQGASIHVEGDRNKLECFFRRLKEKVPPPALIQKLTFELAQVDGYSNFEIRPSLEDNEKIASVLPDLATCPDCLREIFDPSNHRFLYPFTNCTSCGPRYSIVEHLPYDRPNTSMKNFIMCPQCQKEYQDPQNRRFHAQPNACPQCGPHVELWDARGDLITLHHQAIKEAIGIIKRGQVVALKGVGGFQLLVDATNQDAVELLRQRKHRQEKPFALMFPSLEAIKKVCQISIKEEQLLTSAAAPIVLLNKKVSVKLIALAVSPDNPYLGVMLPYSPLHHILMRQLNRPVVATSGNLSDEPICIDEYEALHRLQGIADFFLVHNRPIVRHVDDSIARIIKGEATILRRARGFAPLPIVLDQEGPSVLAYGGHLKNTVALKIKDKVFVSQHIGDLQTKESLKAYTATLNSLKEIYPTPPEILSCDLHHDYISSQQALVASQELVQVQHHHAHIASCMAEHHLQGPVLGFSWDGTGLGTDGTIWGGEFLVCTLDNFKRVGHLRPFRLIGGDLAMREPRRCAVSLLKELGLETDIIQGYDLKIMSQMLEKGINCPLTTSMGRLFDAVASLTGLCHRNNFEGQAAMKLEFVLGQGPYGKANYPYEIAVVDGKYIFNWEMMIKALLEDINKKTYVPAISLKFHNTLVEASVEIARRIGERKVVLSGGCFQNKYLTESLIDRLKQEGFEPFWHKQIPPNDGGLSLGQAVVASFLCHPDPAVGGGRISERTAVL